MNIAETFFALEGDVLALRDWLSRASPLNAQLCVIPTIAPGDENLPVTEITPEHFFGHDAITRSAAAYGDLHVRDGVSRKATRRYAGLLWYADTNPDFTREVCRLVSNINEKKDMIQHFITTNFATNSARFAALHNVCPGVMTLHLYRQIRVWHNADVEAVRFCWQQKTLLTTPDKNELLMQLGRDSSEYHDQSLPLSQLVKRIVDAPEDRLRLRRPAKVQPAANITFRNPDLAKGIELKTVTAPLPYIIIQNEHIDVKILQEFVPRNIQRNKDRNPTEILGTFRGETIEMII